MLRTVIAMALLASTLSAADLPTIDQLPSRPELPDPLKMLDGTPVTTAKQWREERRPELLRLIQHYMYGYAPQPPGITAKVTKTDDTLFDGKGRLKEIEIRINGLGDDAPRIHLALFLPKVSLEASARRVPVFLALNSYGNAAAVDHPSVTIDPNAWKRSNIPKEIRGTQAEFWCVDYLISRIRSRRVPSA